MKSDKIPILVFAAILILLITGCDSAFRGQATENENKQQTKIVYGEITDPIELEALWQEYLYDSSNLVTTSRDFDTPEQIEPFYLAQFCWLKYKNEYDTEELEPEREGSDIRLFPLDTVITYAKRYFDLDGMDISEIDQDNYDPQKKAFLFAIDGKRQPPRPSYDNKLRGKRLEKAIRNIDGTITAMLIKPDHQNNDRIEYKDTFVLKKHQEGGLFFVSGKREYINNNLVDITGEYKHFDKISGFSGNIRALSMIGQAEGKLVCAYTPYVKDETPMLMLINPGTMTMERKLDINEDFKTTDVNIRGEEIIIRLNHKTLYVDKNLKSMHSVELPSIITEKISRVPLLNEYNIPLEIFGGYDISEDKIKYVYSDEIGLKLYNANDDSERLLSKTVPTPDTDLTDSSFHFHPRFVDEGNKVITTMTGYEWALGYTIYDLIKESQTSYDMVLYSSSTGYIRYDTGLMEINSFVRDENGQDGDYKTIYLDFSSGQTKEIHLDDKGDTGYIVMPDQYYVGGNFAGFVTFKEDKSDYTNTEHYLHRLNLETYQVEPEIITVKAAEIHILGVLSDGRVLFWYDLNPSENGICITN